MSSELFRRFFEARTELTYLDQQIEAPTEDQTDENTEITYIKIENGEWKGLTSK